MADGPDISGDGGDVGVRQRRAAFRRHRDRIIPRLRNAVGDDVRDRLQAAVADEPVAVDQRRPLRRTVAVRAVAARASATCDLAMEDAIAQGDFFFRCPGRNGQCRRIGAAGVRVSAFGRPGFAGHSSRRHRRGRGRDRRVGRAMESDPPNTTMLVVGNIKRTVGTDGETGRAERRLTGLFNGAGKAIGKDDEIARDLAVLEQAETRH